jgi:hypothetical protein
MTEPTGEIPRPAMGNAQMTEVVRGILEDWDVDYALQYVGKSAQVNHLIDALVETWMKDRARALASAMARKPRRRPWSWLR